MSTPIPRLSGGVPLLGHLLEMRRNPLALMQRCRDECGEIGEMRLAGVSLVMLYGEAAQKAVDRRPAGDVERDPERSRIVPKREAQELRDPNSTFAFHVHKVAHDHVRVFHADFLRHGAAPFSSGGARDQHARSH